MFCCLLITESIKEIEQGILLCVSLVIIFMLYIFVSLTTVYRTTSMFHLTYVSFNLFWTVFWSFKEGKLEKQLIHNVWMMYTVFFIKSCVSMYEIFFEPLLYYKFTSIWTWYIYQHLCVCFSYFSCKDMCKQKYIPDNQYFFITNDYWPWNTVKGPNSNPVTFLLSKSDDQ